MKQRNKIAVVSENNIWKWLLNLDSLFAKMADIGEKHFEPLKIEDAWLCMQGGVGLLQLNLFCDAVMLYILLMERPQPLTKRSQYEMLQVWI